MNGPNLSTMAMIQQGFRIQPPAGMLGWLPPQFWLTIKDFFAYNANFTPLAAGQSQTQTISIESSSDFILMMMSGVGTAVDNTTPLAFRPVTIDLKDNSSGNTLTQQPTHWENIVGDGRQPGVFAIPYYLKANSSLAVTLQNLDAANARNYRLSFFGFRSYPNSNMVNGNMR